MKSTGAHDARLFELRSEWGTKQELCQCGKEVRQDKKDEEQRPHIFRETFPIISELVGTVHDTVECL